jgi:hypothetical protein
LQVPAVQVNYAVVERGRPCLRLARALHSRRLLVML